MRAGDEWWNKKWRCTQRLRGLLLKKKKKRERERSAANMAKCLDEKIAILETCLYIWNTLKDSFSPNIVYYYKILNTEYSSLCYSVGSCCLSIL